MQCLKCGREIPAGQVFCQECGREMEQYPVEPGTAVLIPKRAQTAPAKKPPLRRPAIPPEEQVRRLKRRLRIVTALLALSIAASALATYLLRDRIWPDPTKPLPGQNYSNASDATETSEK